MSHVLVVDDDRGVSSAFAQVLVGQGYEVSCAASGEEALERLASRRPDVVVMDIRMPGIGGIETLRRMKRLDQRLPVIIMTGHATAETAIAATQQGAFDYHLKPLEPVEILASIEEALDRGRMMNRVVGLDADEGEGADDVIIGQSRGMREVYKLIGKVAQVDASVLIRGETGTGKELVARAIYQHSRRAKAPLVVVNCVAIPEPLLESEFFGHEKGAFTGADKRRAGRFEQASGGTLFLDEIGDMTPGLQAKLLRVLQDGRFERVGGNETLVADVRILAATHRDLEAAVREGRFREDLYHRLQVFTIDIPPLRERPEDIPRLARYFVRKYARENGVDVPVLSPLLLDLLVAHRWPGNVRELEHCLQRALILAGGYPLHEHDLQALLKGGESADRSALSLDQEDTLRTLVREYLVQGAAEAPAIRLLERVERLLIDEALRQTDGNQTRAAKLLGMPRPTMKSRMERLGMAGLPLSPPS